MQYTCTLFYKKKKKRPKNRVHYIKVGLLIRITMVCEIRNLIVTGLGEEISSSKLQQYSAR